MRNSTDGPLAGRPAVPTPMGVVRIRYLLIGSKPSVRRKVLTLGGVGALMCFLLIGTSSALAAPSTTKAAHLVVYRPGKLGMLDCNGKSTLQRSLRPSLACVDVRGFQKANANTWGGRFYDNGEYIGHDEPTIGFLSSVPGSGGNVTWTETLGADPSALPQVSHPGSDISHWFELTPAQWFSMQVCDPESYPQLPCTPNSDANAPKEDFVPVSGVYPGGGSAFVELQLYPPGEPPWIDSISCNDTHWCAALTIDSLECTYLLISCNPACEEPINAAWMQRNGVPSGPPSPQLSDVKSATPNAETLMMNPGDKLKISMSDAPVPGEKGQKALLAKIIDETTGQTGYMQASAKNGFAITNMADCTGTPYNYEPEYSTAKAGNITPWGADQVDISQAVETGHFEPCTSVAKPAAFTEGNFFDVYYDRCLGPYENEGVAEGAETGDALCYPAGDTHFGVVAAPGDEIGGCQANWYQNGDLDFDGSAYWPEWPDSLSPDTFPSAFQVTPPTSGRSTYSEFQFQTDLALSETSCKYNGTPGSTGGCAVYPPGAPGKFYPYYTLAGTGASCSIQFGNMGGNDFGKDAQYGKIPKGIPYPEIIGPIHKNACTN